MLVVRLHVGSLPHVRECVRTVVKSEIQSTHDGKTSYMHFSRGLTGANIANPVSSANWLFVFRRVDSSDRWPPRGIESSRNIPWVVGRDLCIAMVSTARWLTLARGLEQPRVLPAPRRG